MPISDVVPSRRYRSMSLVSLHRWPRSSTSVSMRLVRTSVSPAVIVRLSSVMRGVLHLSRLRSHPRAKAARHMNCCPERFRQRSAAGTLLTKSRRPWLHQLCSVVTQVRSVAFCTSLCLSVVVCRHTALLEPDQAHLPILTC